MKGLVLRLHLLHDSLELLQLIGSGQGLSELRVLADIHSGKKGDIRKELGSYRSQCLHAESLTGGGRA